MKKNEKCGNDQNEKNTNHEHGWRFKNLSNQFDRGRSGASPCPVSRHGPHDEGFPHPLDAFRQVFTYAYLAQVRQHLLPVLSSKCNKSMSEVAQMASKRKGDTSEDKHEKKMKNDLTTYFRRQASGFYKSASDEDKVIAKDSNDKYKAMSKSQQLEFAHAFVANKQSKNLQWMKTFCDNLRVSKKETVASVEKYMTRSSS